MPDVPEGATPEVVQPAIWFPFSVAHSAAEPVWDTTAGRFGPFAGQCFVAEVTNSLIMRCSLEEVQGRIQGACFGFRSGFQSGVNRLAFAPDGSMMVGETNRGWGSLGGQTHGVQRVIYTGQVPFEILSMKITTEGWELKFTRPIDKEKAAQAERWFLESYTYHYWDTYGSPEIERRENKIAQIYVADDGLSVRLMVPDREKRRVYHLQLKDIPALDGAKLLHPDAYYTLNELPPGAVVIPPPAPAAPAEAVMRSDNVIPLSPRGRGARGEGACECSRLSGCRLPTEHRLAPARSFHLQRRRSPRPHGSKRA